MKVLFKIALLLVLYVSTFSLQAVPRVDYKCHVELLGGKQIIYFISVIKNQSETIKSKLVGKNVSGNGYKNVSIYQVKECVIDTETFTSSSAQALDKLTIR